MVGRRPRGSALVAAERRNTARLEIGMRAGLNGILKESTDERTSCLDWLRRYQAGKNSAEVNYPLDHPEFLQPLDLQVSDHDVVSPHRITHLRDHGARYFNEDLPAISGNECLTIPEILAVECCADIADTAIKTHD